MHLDIDKIRIIVGSECKVVTQNDHLYVTPINATESIEKLYTAGFNSLTDCFVTNDKVAYLQLTHFSTMCSIFVIMQYSDIHDINFSNFDAYRAEMKQYLATLR